MSFLVVANFKSHKTIAEVKEWVKAVEPVAESLKNIEVVVAPSAPHLTVGTTLALASQDVSSFPEGSYTGATNAKQLQDLGVRYAIVGHSERRRYFHETHAEVAGKVKELLDVGITPIVCLAEADMTPQRAALDDEHMGKCLFCFEPPSAIGGSEAASSDEINRVSATIKAKYGTEQVMYGGSVNDSNIVALQSLGISGVLVAGASLQATDFIAILKQSSHVA